MSRMQNARQVESAIGSSVLDPARSKNMFYMVPIVWGSTIAPGGSSTATIKLDSGASLSVLSIMGEMRDASTNARLDLANDFPQLLLTFNVNDNSWQQNEVAWSTIVGTGREPFFPQFSPVLSPGVTLNVTARNANASGATVRPFITLGCVRMRI
jgi:hypothetical protein